MSHVSYSSAVGNIMYAMVCTFLDISHGINIFSCYMTNSSKVRWHAIKWVFKYLRGTIDTYSMGEQMIY